MYDYDNDKASFMECPASLPADVLWGSFDKRTPKDVCGEASVRLVLEKIRVRRTPGGGGDSREFWIGVCREGS